MTTPKPSVEIAVQPGSIIALRSRPDVRAKVLDASLSVAFVRILRTGKVRQWAHGTYEAISK